MEQLGNNSSRNMVTEAMSVDSSVYGSESPDPTAVDRYSKSQVQDLAGREIVDPERIADQDERVVM